MSVLTDSRRLDLFRSLLRIRRVEEKIVEKYAEQEMRCPTHFSIGQEAVAAGVCAHLFQSDQIFSGHRSHAHYLAKNGRKENPRNTVVFDSLWDSRTNHSQLVNKRICMGRY